MGVGMNGPNLIPYLCEHFPLGHSECLISGLDVM